MINRIVLVTNNDERGSMMLMFAVMVIPFLFFIFTTSLDLSGYFMEGARTQKFADEAMLRAWKFLPNEGLARQAVSDVAAQYGVPSNAYILEVSQGDLSLSVNRVFPLWFAKYFDDSFALPIRAFSGATGTAFDAHILVDISSYLAPTVGSGVAWPIASPWSAARFFIEQAAALPVLSPQAPSPLERTQHCFNPIFNSVKRSAISAHEYLSSFARNGVGLSVFPSSIGEIERLRPLARGGKLPDDPALLYERGEAVFPFFSPSNVTMPSWCAAASIVAQNVGEEEYRAPTPTASPVFHPAGSLPELVQSNNFTFNDDYRPFLTLRESLWSMPVAARVQNTRVAIVQAAAETIANTGMMRGGLTGSGVSSLIVVSAGFPRDDTGAQSDEALLASIAEIADLVKQRDSVDVRIYYLIVYTEEILGDRDEAAEHAEALATTVQNHVAEVTAGDADLARRFGMSLLFSEGGEEGLQQVFGQLMLARRTAVLSR